MRKVLDNDCKSALTWKSIERENDQKQFGKERKQGGWRPLNDVAAAVADREGW